MSRLYSLIGVDRSAKKQRAKRSQFLFNHKFVNNDLQFIVYNLQNAQREKEKQWRKAHRLLPFTNSFALNSSRVARRGIENRWRLNTYIPKFHFSFSFDKGESAESKKNHDIRKMTTTNSYKGFNAQYTAALTQNSQKPCRSTWQLENISNKDNFWFSRGGRRDEGQRAGVEETVRGEEAIYSTIRTRRCYLRLEISFNFTRRTFYSLPSSSHMYQTPDSQVILHIIAKNNSPHNCQRQFST